MRKLFLLVCLVSGISVFAQTDTPRAVPDTMQKAISDLPGHIADTGSMLDELLEDIEEEPDYELNAFKGTRVINSASTEMVWKNNLDFRVSHRFGELRSGSYDLYGLDQAYMRLSFTYGLTDLINIEIGRSNVGKIYDGSVKWKIMRQAKGDSKRPFGIVLLSNMALQTLKPDRSRYDPYYFTHRLFYTHQVLVSRKFNKNFTLQIMPTLVHRNFIDSQKYKNDVFSLGIGGRNKISRKTAITYEYFYVLPGQINTKYRNSLSVGLDIETGGHVFQLHFTNSRLMNEKGFIAETEGDWLKGGVHFGFNISRIFYLGKY